MRVRGLARRMPETVMRLSTERPIFAPGAP
jgi:hypothetical protein